MLNNTNFNMLLGKTTCSQAAITFFFVSSHPNCITPFFLTYSKLLMRIRIPYHILLPLCCLTVLTACKRDMFDADAYKQVVNESFPVADIDPQHTWELTKAYTVNVGIGGRDDVACVRILNGNPYEEAGVEIMAEEQLKTDGVVMALFQAPACQSMFWAALVTTGGQYIVKSFAAGQENVDFESYNRQENSGTLHKPDYQGFTYLFEDDYPKPGDWDFNDLVLRIRKLAPKQDNEIRLQVTLAAVGTLKKMAAAIRLLNYGFDEVESVSIEEGRTFDGEYEQARQFIETSDLLLRGRNGEAVINLFEDAHWVMYPRVKSPDEGSTTVRMYYNTSRQSDSSTRLQLAPKTLTYVVRMRDARRAKAATLNDLDVFAMEDFNSGKWELHTFANKADQVMCDLGDNATAKANNMVWALKIPSSTFRYPLEGHGLGFYKDGILTGAYQEYDHSYGQWVANRNMCLDWFLHPTTGLYY